MKRYIGIDAHKESCTIAVMGPSGRRLREQIVETNGKLLREFLKSIAGDKHVCLEECEYSEWLYEVCEPVATEIVVVQPEKARGIKSDSVDAWARADELRRDVLARPIFKAPDKFTALREAVRGHLAVQRDLVRVKNRLKGIFRARGIRGMRQELYTCGTRATWLRKLPPHSARRAKLFGDELDRLLDMHEEAERWLLQEAKRVPTVRLIETAPGIGTIRAAYIVATVVSPHRFRTSRQFWSYCGLAIVTRASSEWVKDRKTCKWVRQKVGQTRGLNRNRQPLLKCVFKGAAGTVIHQMPEHPLAQSYERLLAETKPNLARLTLARRLAATVLAMWKNQEVYDPAKQDRATHR